MSSLCFDQQTYKNLLPVPKTHLFMKKITRIQAIDRQMRKKWIKIKRDNEIKNLSITKNDNFSQSKDSQLKKQTSINFQPSKDHSKVNLLQSNMKREQILKNHKRQEQIFYGSRKKHRYQHSLKNQSSSKNFSRNLLSSTFDSPGRKIKTQIEYKFNETSEKNSPNREQKQIYNNMKQENESRNKIRKQHQKFISNHSNRKEDIKLPHMLLRRGQHKDRQSEILSYQSQRQLIELSIKSRQNIKLWGSQKKNLLQKLKGSKAYYIMKNPTRLQQSQNIYFC